MRILFCLFFLSFFSAQSFSSQAPTTPRKWNNSACLDLSPSWATRDATLGIYHCTPTEAAGLLLKRNPDTNEYFTDTLGPLTPGTRYLFAIPHSGLEPRMYVHPVPTKEDIAAGKENFHHDSFFPLEKTESGKDFIPSDCSAAGHLTLTETGDIIIDNESGHYLPDAERLDLVESALRSPLFNFRGTVIKRPFMVRCEEDSENTDSDAERSGGSARAPKRSFVAMSETSRTVARVPLRERSAVAAPATPARSRGDAVAPSEVVHRFEFTDD